jgi:hypothetical protein
MGQYGNQPDFVTRAAVVTPSNTIDGTTNLESAALYVGTGGDVTAIMTGETAAAGSGFPIAGQAIVFKNVPNGTYLPVIVDYVLVTAVGGAADIVACY